MTNKQQRLLNAAACQAFSVAGSTVWNSSGQSLRPGWLSAAAASGVLIFLSIFIYFNVAYVALVFVF